MEVLVVSAVILLFFSGLFASLRTTIALVGASKAEAGALALMNERLEYIRSLPYDSVGTIGGIPSGELSQTGTTTLNGVTYVERTLVQFIDAPEDGTGADDINGITADYKKVKVEYSWELRGQSHARSLISNIVPRGIETVAGGGTLTVNVFDASVQPVADAEVHVFNDTTTTTIDVVVHTNSAGVASFPGAPAAADYEISATKTGFSTDQTYSASSTNPNPNPPHIAVIESEVSTVNFAIDETSDLTVRTVGIPTTNSFFDTFTDVSDIESQSSTTISGGNVLLTDTAGSYHSPGTVRSTSTAPGTFDSWLSAEFSATTSVNTSVIVQFYSVNGSTYSLISDTDLPGNSIGFTTSPVDLGALDPVSYPEIALGATLTTSDPSETPLLRDWEIAYIANEPVISGISFDVVSDKSIGTDGSLQLVPKYTATHTTDGAGSVVINDLEWDLYDIALSGSTYNVAEACNNLPYVLYPNVTETLKLTLAPAVSHSLRVSVVTIEGNPIANANVRLRRSGFDEMEETSLCGQVFFNSGLSAADDYTIEVSASGYTNETLTDFSVDGESTITITMN